MHIDAEISRIRKNFFETIKDIKTAEQLTNVRVVYIGRKGKVSRLLREVSGLPADIRPRVGKDLNLLKNEIEKNINDISLRFSGHAAEEDIDETLPGKPFSVGGRHPLSIIRNKITEIFFSMGFSLVEGPLMEDDWHNFTALNVPEFHPSRDMHDTLYLEGKDNLLLRTHTSPVQVRVMKHNKPPLAVIVPGKCFRNDAIDASHFPVFHQIEGLWVDKDISLSDLKGVLSAFVHRLFGNVRVRFRPSYFPFTEPSIELDMGCPVCGGSGCSTCGHGGFMEIMGAGMVHPEVFRNSGYEEKYQGFAFGMGIERIAMIYYGLADIRDFYNNDLRFLEQFK
ncbi:MAG: phenylalanine--tRNA ligase subunit alpha [Elusimicrobia bacterium CG03_land_8_20_14_0_80_50_18]|nr:MAG: phenylalanine--tRNA ligase subunit alpha [Elusimicrobia bacterium CG03_land_8_20_14_0_80_50_18]